MLLQVCCLMGNMFVLPSCPLLQEYKNMLAHAKRLLEYNRGGIAINPMFDKLITVLRTAVENGEGSLDKEATSLDNVFAFRMSR